jgi:predicted alpha-1,2-mannosidase
MNNLSFRTIFLVLAAFLLAWTSCQVKKTEAIDYTRYVDPFIGTAAHGHTYPGASLPFGMVQLSPDNGISGWDWCSGYHYSDSIIAGFSHLHLSGTGIGDLADVLVIPVVREMDFTRRAKTRGEYPYISRFSHSNEEARPGYYSVLLDDPGVLAELTATLRTGMHRYTFQQGGRPSLVIDLGFAINWDQPTDTRIELVSDTLITGYRFSKGWADDQRVYFALQFSEPIASVRMVLDTVPMNDVTVVSGQNVRAQLFFAEGLKTLLVKAGISSVSAESALSHLAQENPGWDFDRVAQDARSAWNAELGKVQATGDEATLRVFYTALYHAFLAPTLFSDLDGRYKGADGQVYRADYDYYSTLSLWDTFRAAKPLYTLLQPGRVNHFIRSMLHFYDQYGLLPVWALAANETNTMTGYHAIPVIADAYFKGFRDYDVQKAYQAMKASGMQDIRGVSFLKQYGYIPSDLEEESVTKNLEYAYDDWCIAQVAKDLGYEEDYTYFMKRAESYRLLFDPSTGFMRGKMADGSWRSPFDPRLSSHRVGTDYTEGNAWQHTWFVPHDAEGLIQLYGGPEKFMDKLDSMFTMDSEITGDNVSVDISGLIGQYAHGNEPSHHIAYFYNYAGAPWKTQYWVRHIMESQYTDAPDGLCGNEDCGQMSAWYVFSAMGFYPVNPAEGIYVLGSPALDGAVIPVGDGVTFSIETENQGPDNIYVQRVELNGQALDRSYIRHSEILAGGTLRFVLGPEPNMSWAADPSAFPPSMSAMP